MLYWTLPGETEVGSAGEQPAKGYPGQAHQDDVAGRGRPEVSPSARQYIGLIDLSCLRKRKKGLRGGSANLCPRNRARYTSTNEG